MEQCYREEKFAKKSLVFEILVIELDSKVMAPPIGSRSVQTKNPNIPRL